MQVRASGANATTGYTALGANELDWVVEFGIPDSGSWNNDATSSDEYLQFGGSWLYKNKAESQITTLEDGRSFDFTVASCTVSDDPTITVGSNGFNKVSVGMSVSVVFPIYTRYIISKIVVIIIFHYSSCK